MSMGRIRTRIVKQLAEELVKKYPEKFTSNFNTNKDIIKSLKFFEEKLLINKVAGYTVKVVQKQTH